MTVTLFSPRVGERIGPGYRLELTSNFVGPIPLGSLWGIQLKQIGREDPNGIILHQQFPLSTLDQHFLDVTIGDPSVPLQGNTGLQVNVPLDADITLQVNLSEAGPIDSAAFNVKWDPTGRLFVVERGGTTTGGFTATDRVTLQDTSLAVIGNPLDVLGGVLNFPWAEYFGWKPPPQFLARSNETFVLSGEGDLVPPVGRYGLVWQWTTVPVGIGRRPGVPTVYHAEMIVLSEIHRDLQSNEFVSQRVVSNTEGIPYAFLEPQPSRIHYQVLPFVQGVGQWLQLSPF